MSIKKIIASSILVLALSNTGSALAKIPDNIEIALKPTLSVSSLGDNFFGLNSKAKTKKYAYEDMFPKNIIVEKAKTSSPLGFQIFCLQNPSECKVGVSTTIDYSFRTMKKINYINKAVNIAIAPRNDVGIDTWSINVSVGDCEEYVLAKRSKLIKSGIPVGALRIATATTKEGVGHAVLIVRTNKGDMVLDNLTNAVKTWDKVEHIFIAISGATPSKWSIIG